MLLLIAAAVFLVTIVQIGLLQFAFDKLGLSADSAVAASDRHPDG